MGAPYFSGMVGAPTPLRTLDTGRQLASGFYIEVSVLAGGMSFFTT